MATRSSTHAPRGAQVGTREPKSLTIADRGINTSRDFRNFMSAVMSDVIAGRLTPNMTNAACNAGGKMLKMIDLEYKYGTDPERPHRTLTIAFDAEVELAPALPVPKANPAP
jgi:hypothetical protein